MLKPKKLIALLLLFIIVGIAAVSSNLFINGTTSLAKNTDDFLVYFSGYGTIDSGSVRVLSETRIAFDVTLETLGEEIFLPFEITNASKNYDANVVINCTESDEYIDISYQPSDFIIPARDRITSYVNVFLKKSYTGDEDLVKEIVCDISATATERDEIVSFDVSEPLVGVKEYTIGDEIIIRTEHFNVISSTDTTVTMFAQYNIDDSYKQSTEKFFVSLEEDSSLTNTYLDNYKNYLLENITASTLSVSLPALDDFDTMGCYVSLDYTYDSGYTCADSPYSRWVVNGQDIWTETVISGYSSDRWVMFDDGSLEGTVVDDPFGWGVRPIITVSKDAI